VGARAPRADQAAEPLVSDDEGDPRDLVTPEEDRQTWGALWCLGLLLVVTIAALLLAGCASDPYLPAEEAVCASLGRYVEQATAAELVTATGARAALLRDHRRTVQLWRWALGERRKAAGQ
jgi:hypothetical protein